MGLANIPSLLLDARIPQQSTSMQRQISMTDLAISASMKSSVAPIQQQPIILQQQLLTMVPVFLLLSLIVVRKTLTAIKL
jgi:hypothetical protein